MMDRGSLPSISLRPGNEPDRNHARDIHSGLCRPSRPAHLLSAGARRFRLGFPSRRETTGRSTGGETAGASRHSRRQRHDHQVDGAARSRSCHGARGARGPRRYHRACIRRGQRSCSCRRPARVRGARDGRSGGTRRGFSLRPEARSGARIRPAFRGRGCGRPPALPAVRTPHGSRRACVSGLQRSPAVELKHMDSPVIDGSLDLLAGGEVEVLGQLPYSSNYTFLARLREGERETLAVYKPRKGERPLWDFPTGTLAQREVGAWLVSEATGWHLVPPTVLRDDAPMGPGSLQLFIDHDPERHYLVLMEERLEGFQTFAALDVVINNADRKAGHVIEDATGRLWAVDHGITFHVEHKLRTVIWQFAGERLSPAVREGLETVGAELADPGRLGGELAALLSPPEAEATLARVESLLVEDRFPAPAGDRPLPWPLV